ncbi:MAG: NAD-dependent epimerase/dehydratase family protein [Steroidobacteraceae bacterium]
MRVVVIGGLGNFGARICRRLAQEPGTEVIATSRRPTSQGEFFNTAALDTGAPSFAKDLKGLGPDLVIHCAGPFQGQDYRVALASMACHTHYIDIADGRDFVTGFVGAVGPAAEAAGRFAITGASTLPALSSAVVDDLEQSLATLSAIDIVIAPGQHAPRGAATVAGVLGYAGQPFLWWREGKWQSVYGWQELQREQLSFGSRCAAACDVPDLALLPVRYPGVQTVSFRAALEVSLQHYALWLLAQCRRMGLGLPMARWGAHFDRVGTWLNWLGSDTGGMRVRLVGFDNSGQEKCLTWELVAENNHGPEIPCMAAVILANRQHQGDAVAPGARVCMGLLKLSDFEPEFARWGIKTQISERMT